MTKKNNLKITVIDIILFILGILAPGIALLWSGGMLIDFIKNHQNVLIIYAQFSLTFFGFTFLSAVFEKANPKYEVKRLFYLSLIFLVSAISFFIMYSGSFLAFTGVWICISNLALIILVILSFGGLAFGAMQLLKVLLEYAKNL